MESTLAPGTQVRGWIERSGLTMAATAQRAGVSTSTLHRVLNDQVDPSLGTLRDIAIACGVQLNLTASALSDPAAAAAARTLIQPGYRSSVSGVEEWVARLRRQAGEDPAAIVRAAGVASAPLERAGAVHLTGVDTVGALASAGDASGGRWALSGRAGVELTDDLWAPSPAPTILWCEQPKAVVQLLGDAHLTRTDRPDRAMLTVLEADAALFSGMFAVGSVNYAAPIQIMLDCFGIGGELAEFAAAEVTSWGQPMEVS